MHITLWRWIPDLRDTVIPFVVGVLELILNHTISLSLSAWLLIMAIIASMAMLAIWYVGQRAKEEDENNMMLNLLRKHLRLYALYNLGAGALYLLLAVVSRVESLEAGNEVQSGQGILALAIFLLVAGCITCENIISMRCWNQAIAYSRTGRIPGTLMPHPQASPVPRNDLDD
jgi:hypothetical protein